MKRWVLLIASIILAPLACRAQQIIPIVSGNATINMAATPGTSFKIFVTGAFTLSITNQPTNNAAIITILFAQDATGHAVTFSASSFKNTTAVPTTANSNTPESFQYDGNSNFWYGIAGGSG